MSNQFAGYRHREYDTVESTTYAIDFNCVPEGHEYYIEVLSARTSRSGASLLVSIDCGGELHPVWHVASFSANTLEQSEIGFKLFAGERLHWYWSALQAGDNVEMTAIGVDKWGKE